MGHVRRTTAVATRREPGPGHVDAATADGQGRALRSQERQLLEGEMPGARPVGHDDALPGDPVSPPGQDVAHEPGGTEAGAGGDVAVTHDATGGDRLHDVEYRPRLRGRPVHQGRPDRQYSGDQSLVRRSLLSQRSR